MLNNLLPVFIILLFINTASAQSQALVVIEPANPQTDDNISIGVLAIQCSNMPVENSQGLTHYIQDNAPNPYFFAVAEFPPLPGGIICPPQPRIYYDLGKFSEGNHSIAVLITNQFFTFPPDAIYDPPPPYDIINFSVTTPQIIISNNNIGLLILMLIIMILAYRYKVIKNKI